MASPTHPSLAWTVNDSGGSASVYGVSLEDGDTVAVLRLAGTQARDWESMAAGRDATGRSLIWVGDTGDNRSVRESVVLRLVREPTRVASATLTPVSLRVAYPEGPRDVEALIWTPDGRLLLVSKQLFTAVVYQVPAEAVTAAVAGRSTSTPVTAQRVATVPQGVVTDGTALPDGRIVLRGYDGAGVYDLPAADATGEVSLTASAQLTLPAQEQGETITAVDDGAAVLVGSEGERQPLWRVAVPARVPAPVSAPVPAATSSSSVAGPTASPATRQAASSGAPLRAGQAPRPGLVLLALAAAGGVALVVTARRRAGRR